MSTIIKKNGKTIHVVSPNESDEYLSANDIEMDRRAQQAIKAAIEKAEFCGKPVAKYDNILKKTYLEYKDGRKEYVE